MTYNPTCDEAQVLSVFCTPYPNILYFPYAQVKTAANSSSLPQLAAAAGRALRACAAPAPTPRGAVKADVADCLPRPACRPAELLP